MTNLRRFVRNIILGN